MHQPIDTGKLDSLSSGVYCDHPSANLTSLAAQILISLNFLRCFSLEVSHLIFVCVGQLDQSCFFCYTGFSYEM